MSGGLVLGNNLGNGVVNQSGGTINASWVDVNGSGVGSYNLSGGTLNTLAQITIGRSGGSGTMTISGGSVNTGVTGAAPGVLVPSPFQGAAGGNLVMTAGALKVNGE